MLLSVVVPVFNMADTLDTCLESIVGQDCPGMEIVVVDDGSTDGSAAKCDDWSRRGRLRGDELRSGWPRIKVVHKANGGLSDARNAGIEMAKGDYITFADADDFVAAGTYSRLMKELDAHPEYDILEYQVRLFYGSKRESTLAFADKTYTSGTAYWIETRAYKHAYAWNKIYRRELFGIVRYPVGKVFEDAYTLPQLLKQAHTIATTSTGEYFYRENGDGITATAGAREWRMLLEAHLNMLREIPYGEYMQDYYLFVLNIQLQICKLTKEKPRLPNHKIVHPLCIKPLRLKIKAVLLNLLGINKLCRIFTFINF
ncbi:MAG: glycosyltransferase [Prevotella sp.]|nr:glycosyltransferase [Prevotella sp.]